MSDVPAEPQGWEAWAPPLNPPDPAGMPRDVAQGIADEWWPDQPYVCAGLQWQWYALSLPAKPALAAVTTGVQTVSYAGGATAFDAAMARAEWFLSRVLGSLESVPLTSSTPEPFGFGPLRDMSWWIDP